MTKRATLAGFAAKKTPEEKPVAQVSPTGIASEQGPILPAVDKRKGQTLRLSPEAWRQLKRLGVEQDSKVHDLLVQAVNSLFVKHNLPPIA